jgi:hypothetical protein
MRARGFCPPIEMGPIAIERVIFGFTLASVTMPL